MNPAYASWAQRYRPRGRGAPTLMLALQRLVERVNHAGAIDGVGVRALAASLGSCDDTGRLAQRVLGKLREAGLISIEPQFAGRAQIANRYRLMTEWVQRQLEQRWPTTAPPAPPGDTCPRCFEHVDGRGHGHRRGPPFSSAACELVDMALDAIAP